MDTVDSVKLTFGSVIMASSSTVPVTHGSMVTSKDFLCGWNCRQTRKQNQNLHCSLAPLKFSLNTFYFSPYDHLTFCGNCQEEIKQVTTGRWTQLTFDTKHVISSPTLQLFSFSFALTGLKSLLSSSLLQKGRETMNNCVRVETTTKKRQQTTLTEL